MPTYDYRCKACGHEFEEFQSMSAKPLRKCPECGKLQLERLIGIGAGVIFKGGGFYETDYRSDSYKKGAEADKKAKDEGGDKKKGKDGAKDAKTDTSSSSKSSESKPKSSGSKGTSAA